MTATVPLLLRDLFLLGGYGLLMALFGAVFAVWRLIAALS
jgi:hypothetical protein